MSFCHLHVHSEYSLMDGSIRVKELVARVAEMGHSHVAVTDHGNLHCAVEFYTTAKQAGIVPIIGCEIYCQMSPELTEFGCEPGAGSDLCHLVVLARNAQGYRDLIKLVSRGYFGDRLRSGTPTLAPADLEELLTNNLLALSGCLRGEFGVLVRRLREIAGDGELPLEVSDTEAGQVCRELQRHRDRMHQALGKGGYYVEVVDNGLPAQKILLPDLVAAARWLEIPIVASGDCHYLDKDFAETHMIAIAIKNKMTTDDLHDRLTGVEFHLFSSEEMQRKFAEWPEALENTMEVAEKCSGVEIDMGSHYLPRIDLGTHTPEQALRHRADEGLRARLDHLRPIYGDKLDKAKEDEYFQRLEYELDVIVNMGFPDYFLIVQDFIQWAKDQGIPVGPGRGSGAGSLVAYALRITDIDPLPYNLIFERFLNPDRVSLPDFDVDFCQWRREEVIDYCVKKYGENQVAQITTFGKMLAKGAVKSVGRAMNISFGRMDRFTKLFPTDLGITLTEAMEKEPLIGEAMAQDDHLKQCMEYALELEGIASHTSVHAAGVVISDGPMVDYVPVYTTDGKTQITQYEMKPTEKVGLVKFDFLGLKTLTVIDHAVKMIQSGPNPELRIDRISMDDPSVFQLLSKGLTCGVFQCESGGMTALITKLKPSNFEDVIALVALFRPGPLGSGMVDDFVERKHGRQKITYLHPSLEPILKDTYGMILYQEQVQKIAAVLANYTLGEADLLRRAMGKKIPEEMAKQKDRFLTGARDNEIDPKLAEEIFDLMAEFAKYGFNKSHSAAYGLVSYQTAYLKTHYPEEFLAASMVCDMENTDKIVRYLQDCPTFNIKVHPPCIQMSFADFRVPNPKEISFALGGIKGIGKQAVSDLVVEREQNGPFGSLGDLARRIDLHKLGKKTLQLLIAVGALDSFKIPRHSLLAVVDQVVRYSQQLFEAERLGHQTLFGGAAAQESLSEPWDTEQLQVPGEPIFTLRDLEEERKLLGVYLSKHPIEIFRPDIRAFGKVSLADLEKHAGVGHKRPKEITVAGFVSTLSKRRSKKGNLINYVGLEQPGIFVEGLMFQEAFEQSGSAVRVGIPVVAHGSVFQNQDKSSCRFIINKMVAMEDLRRSAKRFVLEFDGLSDQTVPDLAPLLECFRKFPGTIPMDVSVKLATGTVKIRCDMTVDPCDGLLGEVMTYSGADFRLGYRLQVPS